MKNKIRYSALILLLIMTVMIFNPYLSASAAGDLPGTGIIALPDIGTLMKFTVTGGNITKSTNDGWESQYFIEGTVHPGETLSIAASGNGSTMNYFNPVNEDLDGDISVWFDAGNGQENVEMLILAPGESGSVASSFIVPSDARTVKIVGILNSVWWNSNGGGSKSLILNVEFEVVEEETPIIVQLPEPVSGSSNPATNSTAGQLVTRVIVVAGIAVAGTMSTLAGELANKAAQPAGRVSRQPAGHAPGQSAEPGLEKMTPAEKQQLENKIADYKAKLNQLRIEEIAWRKAQRNAWELYQKAKAQYQSNSVKVIFKFGKEIGDGISTILSPTGKIVNLGAEKFTEQVVEMAAAPVPSDATDAEILESQRKKISDLKEKYEEARRMRAQKNSECNIVEERINGLNARLKNAYLVPWH